MRLFVAIYPPSEALDDIVAHTARLRIAEATAAGINVRLAARETMHLTLVFLGDVAEERLPAVETALERAAADARRDAADPLRLRFAGGGRFGRGRFTVLWAGVDGDLAGLHALHNTVRRELRRARVPSDYRPYRPHLTLARPGDRMSREAVDADRAALHDYLGPTWPVTEIVLVRSQLGPRPQHHRLAAWPI